MPREKRSGGNGSGGSTKRKGWAKCDWTSNNGQTPCTIPASLSNSPYGEGGYCAFHYDCAGNQAQHSPEGFREWLDYTREVADRHGYGKMFWTVYTEAALWDAMNGKGLPPLERNVRKDPPVSPQAVAHGVRACLAVAKRRMPIQEAIDALHAEHGCPQMCSDHPGGPPQFDNP